MKNNNFSTTLLVNKTAYQVFDAINNIPGWWTVVFEGDSKKTGDVFTVRFGETFITIQLTALIPDKKIDWKVIDCYKHWLKDKKEWLNTTMSWEISSEANMTKIDFTHYGLIPGIECYNGCENAWNSYIKESLYNLIMKGEGKPTLK